MSVIYATKSVPKNHNRRTVKYIFMLMICWQKLIRAKISPGFFFKLNFIFFPNCPWWRHQIETFSALLATLPVTGEFFAQRPVTRSFDVLFDLRLINSREDGDSRRHRAHYDVILVLFCATRKPIAKTKHSSAKFPQMSRDKRSVHF